MKSVKKVIALALALLLMLSLAACGGTDAKTDNSDRVIKFGVSSIVKSFNPMKFLTINDPIGYLQVYDTLLQKYDGDFTPCLADSWEISPDGLVYTFHLHEGVTWSDGEPFTAEDCVFTVNKILEEQPSFSYVFANVVSAEAPDELTYVLTISAPDATLLSYLCCDFGVILPKHAYEEYGDSYGESVDTIVGTGPYVVTAWTPDVSVSYTARDDYFRGAADIKNIEYVTIADANSATVALQTGELDIYFTSISGVSVDTLNKVDSVSIDYFYTGRNDSIYMNCQNGIFSDVRMRQAVAYAINKEDALSIAFNNQGEVVNYPSDVGEIMTANPDFTPTNVYTQDIEKAKALVEECGNTGASVTINSLSGEPWSTLSVYLQDCLNNIGLDAKIETLERSAMFDAVANCEAVIFPWSWGDTTYDFGNAFGIYVNSANAGMSGNFGWYMNDEVDELLNKAKASFDVTERQEYYKQVIEIYCEEVPSIPLYANQNAYAHSSDIETKNPVNYLLYDYSWVEQAE